jgi:hypothetical protein
MLRKHLTALCVPHCACSVTCAKGQSSALSTTLLALVLLEAAVCPPALWLRWGLVDTCGTSPQLHLRAALLTATTVRSSMLLHPVLLTTMLVEAMFPYITICCIFCSYCAGSNSSNQQCLPHPSCLHDVPAQWGLLLRQLCLGQGHSLKYVSLKHHPTRSV